MTFGPSNVLLDDEGNAYLADFSIAKDLASTDATVVSTGLIYYASPEEIRGEPLTPQADVYSLGLVLHELLAGRHPFADVPASQVRERHLSGSLPSIAIARPDLPPGLDEVLRRATAKDATDRYPDALSLAAAFRFAIETGAQVASLPAVEWRNPYKGLRPFTEADAPDFFGRGELTARLVARLGEPAPEARFLAVVGPSGSGKSSVVRAGLIPALRSGALPGSEGWFVVEMHPGSDPFAELESALLSVAVSRPASMVETLESDELGLVRSAGWVLPREGSELLVVIDQFEEVFTLVQDPRRQRAFLEILRTAVVDPTSRVRVVVALRADFYDRPLLHKSFGDLLGARTQTITGLSPEELERAIVGPAGRAGVTVEAALLGKILTEVAEQPSALPLLQYGLTELFERRESSTLTLEAYREMGGVLGVLGRRAEELFERLDQPEKRAARQLFLRLVTVGEEGTAETRRRVLRSELTSVEVDRAAMDRVIDLFDSHRLLSFDRDPITRGPTVEVAHEALMREWGRLRGWIETAREDIRMHRRLAAAAAEWEGAGRDPSFLVRGERLSQLEAWSSTSGLSLTGGERLFLESSSALRETERAEEAARKAREAALERRSRTRLRALVAVLTVATLVASTLTVVALNQRERARREATAAKARELASAALANLEVDPELSILLALESVPTARSSDTSVLQASTEVLHRAITSSRIVATMPGAGSLVDWSPQGDVLAFAGGKKADTVELRSATTGAPIRSWKVDEGSVTDIEFSPDGSLLATAGDRVRLWDPATGQIALTLRPNSNVSGLSFSSDGMFLAGVSASSGASVWGLTTGRRVGAIAKGQLFTEATALSPDGSQLAVARDIGADVYEVASGERLRTLGGHPFNVIDVDWSQDGSRLATTSLAGTVRIWAASGEEPLDTLVTPDAPSDWSPDGSRLVTGSEVFEIGPGGQGRPLLTLAGHAAPIRGVAVAPDGTRVVTADEGGTAKVWDLGLSGDAEWMNLPAQRDWDGDVTFSPDGRTILGSAPGSTVGIWDAATGQEVLTLAGHEHPGFEGDEGIAGIAVSPDGRLIATAGRDRTVKVWQAATGRELFTFDFNGDWIEEVRFSPDGKLLAASVLGTARVFDVVTWRELHTLEIASTPEIMFSTASVQFSSDGRWLVTGSWDGTVRVFDPETGAEVRRIEFASKVDNIAPEPDGTRVAVAAGDRASVWDLRGGEQVAALPDQPAFAVAFSPDGLVATATHEDGLVRVWNPEDGSVLILRGHTKYVTAVAFNPDGSKLASLGAEGVIRVWAVDVDDLIEIAQQELTRTFTQEECRQYLHVDECPSGG